MKTYSQEEIDRLISCPKVITEPPRKEMKPERGSQRNNMLLRSTDGVTEFSVFMRVNDDFRENFSIGLIYHPRDERGALHLLRCNGPHGDFIGSYRHSVSHFRYHFHRAKAENIVLGLRPEFGGEVTEGYGCYKDALSFFLREINLINAGEYFPELSQPGLDLNLVEQEREP
ncbi:MAG: hypothetical protein NTY51_08285 [Deltaproteobacteria bacterium]|nr:hypothetical protein [Deltaproteobacteria bacterium]